MTTTLSAEKQAWADSHKGQTVEMALRGHIDTYTVLDDGTVRFHVVGGSMTVEDGEELFHEDGTDGTFIASPPLSADEVAAQLAAREAEDEAARAEAQAAATADAQAKSEEFNAAVAAEVEKKLVELGVIPDPGASAPTS